ncbi:isochorismatase family protein, partial [Actinacidiphila rubida]
MQIPPIEAYPMPTREDLPAGTARWRLDAQRCVLLVHDMQHYFLDMFPAGREPVTTLVANAARLREGCRAAGVPVAYTAQPGGMTARERGLLSEFWGPGMSRDPAARAIVEPLAPAPGDQVFTKWRYSAFHRTGLLAFLREQGRDQLVVCGVYAHIGCLVTAVDAYSHDIEPFLAADALADFSAADHKMALEYAAG